MIQLENISRSYKMGDSTVEALEGVSLGIERGDHLSLVGPSGSGKSTLLHILGCLDRPTGGTYTFEGHDVGAMGEQERSAMRSSKIGFVFQFFHLLPRLTAVGNIELPMLFAGVEKLERRERALKALDSVGLAKRGGHKPEQLSGGERQRVAIARAVIMGPSLLLADEPTGNLDKHSAADVLSLLSEMNRNGLTLVVVTHDPAIAARGRRTIRLDDGLIVDEQG